MADKGSFPEGFAFPLLPKSRKRKLSCSTLCIICQTDRPGEPLRKAKEDSIEKVITATEQCRDEEVRARFVSHDVDTGIPWHSTCYASYTSDQNIRYKMPSDALQHTSRQKEINVISSRTFCSATAPADWSRCFICENKTHKKSRDLINLCTFEACESIQIAAERKGDSSMLHILNGVNGDLIQQRQSTIRTVSLLMSVRKPRLACPKEKP